MIHLYWHKNLLLKQYPSQLTFNETEYHEYEITKLYEKRRELTTEIKAIKSFVIE